MLSKKIVVFILLSVFLIGCRTAPVMNVDNAPFNTATEKMASMTVLTREIIEAGTKLGWQMKKEAPGHILGTLYLREHMVKVDVRYTNKDYSITYKDSSNMKYDGTNIHSNYNGWVQNLSNAINTEVFNSSN